MQGCRPLTDSEIVQISMCLHNGRDLLFFKFGLHTGFRASELLSLRVADVWQGGRVVDRVTVSKRNMKGKKFSRSLILSPALKAAITAYLETTGTQPELYLFRSREGGNRPISRTQAYRAFLKAASSLGIGGKVALHSMRKVFANRAYIHFKGNLFLTAKALGHRSIDSTSRYLSFRTQEVDEAVLAMGELVAWPK